ncbi:hypothetical protein MJD09_20230, partial [bacterium]|nr:hypothetical protein [bacterium]
FSEVKKSLVQQKTHEKKWRQIRKLSELRMQELDKLLTLRQKQAYDSFELEQRLKYQTLKKVLDDAFGEMLDIGKRPLIFNHQFDESRNLQRNSFR